MTTPRRFDEVYAELQAKMAAAMAVIATDPVMAAAVREAIDGAQTADEIAEGEAQDEARANVLNNMILGVREMLASAVGASGGEGASGASGEEGSSGASGE